MFIKKFINRSYVLLKVEFTKNLEAVNFMVEPDSKMLVLLSFGLSLTDLTLLSDFLKNKSPQIHDGVTIGMALTKEQRTDAYRYLTGAYPNVDSRTVDVNGSGNIIKAKFRRKRGGETDSAPDGATDCAAAVKAMHVFWRPKAIRKYTEKKQGLEEASQDGYMKKKQKLSPSAGARSGAVATTGSAVNDMESDIDEDSTSDEPEKGHAPGLHSATCHVWFCLAKRNLEQTVAQQRIADSLGVPIGQVQCAGIKDKRAVTFQQASVTAHSQQQALGCRASARDLQVWVRDKLLQINQESACPASDETWVKVGKISFNHRRPVSMGELWGNRFEIVIRNIRLQPNLAADRGHGGDGSERHESLNLFLDRLHLAQSRGCPNYFGSQRMGSACGDSSKPISPIMGQHIVQGKYEAAVRCAICGDGSPRGGLAKNTSAFAEAMQVAQDSFLRANDAASIAATINLFPKNCHRERALLKGLRRFGMSEKGFEKAFLGISYSVRLLWKHAYQSW